MAEIRGSVGRGGANNHADVETVQSLLNRHIMQLAPLGVLNVNGDATQATIAAIEKFQRVVVGMANPDGRVDEGGKTLRALSANAADDSTTDTGDAVTISGKSLPSPAAQVLAEILESARLNAARVTSVVRSPAEQARVMYDNIESRGLDYNRRLYGDNGDAVIKVYEENRSKPRAEIVNLMKAKIDAVGPGKVSKHCSTTHYVFDVAPSSIADHAKFIAAAELHAAVTRLLRPPTDPAFHIEIPKDSPYFTASS